MTADLSPHETVRKLMERKEDIEAEIEGHRGRLEAEKSTMHSPLVTLDGFPRDDIDVLAVRTARVRILELRNDLARVMDHISLALQQAIPATEQARPAASGSGSSNGAAGEMDVDPTAGVPFALVRSVDPAGPGASAGIQAGDRLVSFGSVTEANHDGLKALAGQVRQGERVELELLRGGGADQQQTVRVGLVPREGWGGRGLIGMHIVPV